MTALGRKQQRTHEQEDNMNKFASLFAAFAVLPGLLSPALAMPGNATLIVPGKSIGKMALGPDGAEVLEGFGEPDIRDVGMSQTRQVWLGKGNRDTTLCIHTVANGALDAKPQEGMTIDAVRTSSGSFHTVSGIAVGSTLMQIQHSFPHARRVQARGSSVVYEDSQRGIAFEFAHDRATARCIGITVLTPGEKDIISGEAISSLVSEHHPKRER